VQIRKEVEEFQVQIAKLRQFLESDLVRSMASLKRMSEALDKYVQQSGAGGGTAEAGPSNAVPTGEGT